MALTKVESLRRRHQRVRRKLSGTPERPRLCIHKSSKHLYAQIVDDTTGTTVCFVTTNTSAAKAEAKSHCNIVWAKRLGGEMATQASTKGITAVVFDRGGYRYHGVIKAFGDAARAAGMKF